MACAAILSFAECCDTQRCAEIRPRLHDRLDQWLKTLEARVQEPIPTLEQLTQAVFALRQELTQAVTEGWVEQAQRAVMEPRTATCPQCGQPWRPLLVLASDGAAVPTRPETAKGRRPGRKNARAKRARWTGEWREAQGFRCYRLADDRMVQGLSWHQVQTDAAAAEALRPVKAAGWIPEPPVRRCVMADGAPWIWTQARALCPSAVEMLDYDHGREPLHTVAALP